MKTLNNLSDPTAQIARRAAEKARAEGRPHLKVVKQEPALPAQLLSQQPSARIEISAEGRARLSEWAERTEVEMFSEAGDDTIAELVAEGIEEGFLE